MLRNIRHPPTSRLLVGLRRAMEASADLIGPWRDGGMATGQCEPPVSVDMVQSTSTCWRKQVSHQVLSLVSPRWQKWGEEGVLQHTQGRMRKTPTPCLYPRICVTTRCRGGFFTLLLLSRRRSDETLAFLPCMQGRRNRRFREERAAQHPRIGSAVRGGGICTVRRSSRCLAVLPGRQDTSHAVHRGGLLA